MKLTLKKEVEETVDIELPVFFKNEKESGVEYVAGIDEKNAIRFVVGNGDNIKTLSHGALWIYQSDLKDAFMSWQTITEEEFLTAHEALLKSLSLSPQLVEAGDPDDLKTVF